MKKTLMLAALGLAAALCLCGGNLQAQDDNGGGPGGPPPDGGPGGPGGPGDNGGPGGPGGPPGDLGNGGRGGPGGNFDPAQFQQRMQEQIRKNLSVTNDDEWAAIQPLIQKVMEARRGAGPGGGMGPGPGGPGGRGRLGPQASSEQQALQKAIEDDAPAPQIKAALAKYRAARADKQAQLAEAQTSLKNVLSVKQEAQAVLLGLLP